MGVDAAAAAAAAASDEQVATASARTRGSAAHVAARVDAVKEIFGTPNGKKLDVVCLDVDVFDGRQEAGGPCGGKKAVEGKRGGCTLLVRSALSAELNVLTTYCSRDPFRAFEAENETIALFCVLCFFFFLQVPVYLRTYHEYSDEDPEVQYSSTRFVLPECYVFYPGHLCVGSFVENLYMDVM